MRRSAALALVAIVLFASAAAGAAPDADDYAWTLPPGFPRPAVPADNPMNAAKVALGERLFNDTALSANGAYACASCHRRELAFTDGRARAIGSTGEVVRRGAMTLTNVAYNINFTWASRRVRSLEAQMRQPLFNRHPLEMGLAPDGAQAVRSIQADAHYAAMFAQAFPEGGGVSMEHIIKAIAAYERTLISGRAPFDRYVFDDDRSAMSAAALRGMALFYSERVGCGGCHSGLNFSGPIRYESHLGEQALFASNALYDLDGRGTYPGTDQGLIEETHRGQDMGKFRVPTLRNVALTAPYMHDGSLATLEEVVRHYETGGHSSRRAEGRLKEFRLSEPERADLIAFLAALTDPGFLRDPPPKP